MVTQPAIRKMTARKNQITSCGGWARLKVKGTGFFRVEKIQGKRWWLITPEGHAFLSLGVNHADSSTLKYPDNISIYRKKYGCEKNWIQKGLARDLKAWGFNTLGWCQEVVIRHEHLHIHSPPWRIEQYQWAGMPYCHLLPFIDNALWDPMAFYPDVFSREFEDWCDYVARSHCADMADDPMLIGYFYSDVPGWSSHPHVKPWAADCDLSTAKGHGKLHRIARRYYTVIHHAIRRYDRNHLLLGDRYMGQAPLPEEVLLAMRDTVDVMSIQYFDYFAGEMREKFDRWAAFTGKPILLADCAFVAPTPEYPDPPILAKHNIRPTQAERGKTYQAMAAAFLSHPYAIGWHWCSYIENRVRRHGLKNRLDQPHADCVKAMTEFNRRVYEIVGGL